MFKKEKFLKTITCMVMSAILATTLMMSAFAADTGKKGDVDGDGNIKMGDVVMLQKAIAELTKLDDAQKDRGDVTFDKLIKMDDVVAIQKYIAELITSFGNETSDTDSSTPVNTDSDTPVNTDTDTPVNTDTDTPVNTDTDTPVNTDTDTPVNTDTDTTTDTDTSTDTESDEESGWTQIVYKP